MQVGFPFFLARRDTTFCAGKPHAGNQDRSMQTKAPNPELHNHFSVAIYPFVHDLTAGVRSARLEALGERWAPWWTRLTEEGLTNALQATGFFLPYVRSLLYPEVAVLQDEPP